MWNRRLTKVLQAGCIFLLCSCNQNNAQKPKTEPKLTRQCAQYFGYENNFQLFNSPTRPEHLDTSDSLKLKICQFAGFKVASMKLTPKEEEYFREYTVNWHNQHAAYLAISELVYMNNKTIDLVLKPHPSDLLREDPNLNQYYLNTGKYMSLVDTGADTTVIFSEQANISQTRTYHSIAGVNYVHGEFGDIDSADIGLRLKNVFLSPDVMEGRVGNDVLVGHNSICFDLANKQLLPACNLQAEQYKEIFEMPFYFGLASSTDQGSTARIYIDMEINKNPTLALLDTGTVFTYSSADYCPITENTITLDGGGGNHITKKSNLYKTSATIGNVLFMEEVATICVYQDQESPFSVIGNSILNQTRAFEIDSRNRIVRFYR